MKRLAFDYSKMVFISGPRQCGKTTFAKQVLKERGAGQYYNWDDREFRRKWVARPKDLVPKGNDGTTPVVVFDEIHKAKGWKSDLKGLYDTLEQSCQFMVTGSARLDVYKKGGDSLLGRYLGFRLHPFSLGELTQLESREDPEEIIRQLFESSAETAPEVMPELIEEELEDRFSRLWKFGGFPEPLFRGSEEFANAWRRTRVEQIIREDLRDLSRIPELSQIEMLVALLPERVGGLMSVQSLREDLEVAHDTVSRWLNYLKELYYLFELRPYSKSLVRSLKKESKIYFYDWSEIDSPGSRFENLVACHLLKACHFWTDIGKGKFDLNYLRNKEKREVDFLIVKNQKPWMTVECKLSDTQMDPSIFAFSNPLNLKWHIQIVRTPGIFRRFQKEGVEILIASASHVLRLFP